MQLYNLIQQIVPYLISLLSSSIYLLTHILWYSQQKGIHLYKKEKDYVVPHDGANMASSTTDTVPQLKKERKARSISNTEALLGSHSSLSGAAPLLFIYECQNNWWQHTQ